ncbi:MAG: hypothetical protein ABH881_02600 [bacterium]
MKKIIQILSVIILISILSLIVVFVFNPFGSREKLIGSIINSYLSSTIESYTPLENSIGTTTNNSEVGTLSADKHPLLNEDQEKKLESLGVNIEQLPSSITPIMEECFVEKLGRERADQIAKGDTPSAIEFFKAKDCIGK